MNTQTDEKARPRVLLLAATPPGSSGTGQIFLGELCRTYPQDRLSLAVLGKQYRESDREQFSHLPKIHCPVLESASRGRWPASIDLFRRHYQFRLRRNADGACLKQLVKFCEKQRPDLIWAVFDVPSIMRLAPRLARATGLPLVGTILDPPQGVGLLFGLDRLSRLLVKRDFAAAIRACSRCGVISERMQEEYRADFGVETVILRHGINPADQLPSIHHDDDINSEIRIGFCGSLYAEDEWQSFLKGLDLVGWRIGNRRIRVTVMGDCSPTFRASVPAQFEFLGWRDMHEVIERLSRCHFTYLPYWFHPAYADSVRLCFPSKLTPYLIAGRPVLYHGPKEASVVDFFNRFGFGVCCHSLDPESVAESVRGLANLTTSDYEQLTAGTRTAVREELNRNVFLSRFDELISGQPPLDDRPKSLISERIRPVNT